MKVIGLTGGIGSGKSTVLNFFKALGAETYIADVEAKKLMNSDKELIQKIKELFGEEAYVNSQLNRKYIAAIVFKDSKKLQELNNIIHPKVRQHFQSFIQQSTAEIIIYEAAILFESGGDKFCDYTITVTANLEDKIQRIIKRDKISKAQIIERMKHQLNDDFRIKNSHFVIVNTTFKGTEIQVKTSYDLILNLP
jgi:dephospho-CoA kinase